MKRRSFITNMMTGAASAAAAPVAWAVGEKKDGTGYGIFENCPSRITELAGMSLTENRDFHLRDFHEGYLPYWDGTIRVDSKYGGFMPYLNNDGAHVRTTKEMYYQGRGVWVFSYIYNHLVKEQRFLDVADKAIKFCIKHCLMDNNYWISEVSREGKQLSPSNNIYGDMYIAMGLGEFYKATGDEKMKQLAIDSVHAVNERVVSAEYQHLGGHGAGHEPGTKRLGTWQHFLGALTPLAMQTGDFGVEMIARMCVRNILERHWQPDLGIAYERLDDQFQPFRVDSLHNNRAISGWHSIQAAWMVMAESLRTGHKANFMQAMEMGRITLEKTWYDDGEEAGISSISNPEAKPSPPSKGGYLPWHAIDDGMLFALLAIEHANAPWAHAWYDKMFRYAYSKPERMMREGLLHHPRRLFYAPEIIDHMVKRDGRISDFLT